MIYTVYLQALSQYEQSVDSPPDSYPTSPTTAAAMYEQMNDEEFLFH
jgi:hypothetical protein